MIGQKIPFFKFFPYEHLTGKIQCVNEEAQGVYLNVASYYWKWKCKITLEQLNSIYPKAANFIELFVKHHFLKINKHKEIVIKELKNQFELIVKVSKIRAIVGRKGGKVRQAIAKQMETYKDRDKDKRLIINKTIDKLMNSFSIPDKIKKPPKGNPPLEKISVPDNYFPPNTPQDDKNYFRSAWEAHIRMCNTLKDKITVDDVFSNSHNLCTLSNDVRIQGELLYFATGKRWPHIYHTNKLMVDFMQNKLEHDQGAKIGKATITRKLERLGKL